MKTNIFKTLGPCRYGYHLWYNYRYNGNIHMRSCFLCKQEQIKEDIHNVPAKAVEFHEGSWRDLNMNWNDEIREFSSSFNVVYSPDCAKYRYQKNKNYRKFSIMKQENIRMAILEGYPLDTLKDVLKSECTYCTNFREQGDCRKCPLYMMIGTTCFNLKNYIASSEAISIVEFVEHHKQWCIELGLWNDNWR